MSETVILNTRSIEKGPINNGRQLFIFHGQDKEDNSYYLLFDCPMCYTESIEKYLSRLCPVVVKDEDEEVVLREERKTNNEGK